MKHTCLPAAMVLVPILSISILAQSTIVINTPGEEPAKPTISAADQRLMDKNILPKVRKRLAGEACEEAVEVDGVIHGAFSKVGADQTLIFYQFCQTGNGLGSVGVALFEGGKVVGNYVSEESGWSQDAKILPDINKNGLNEVALYYSGGMHQGSGGTGVDIMEFTGRGLAGIGWFQAESFTEKSLYAFKVSVKPRAVPQFFQEKWTTNSKGKYRKIGNITPLKLKPVFGKFEVLR